MLTHFNPNSLVFLIFGFSVGSIFGAWAVGLAAASGILLALTAAGRRGYFR